ncbi:MAG: hypothetical protein H8E12_01735 [Rhodobacteraceae bacterium]|nr:hypothetical protein [Paracoccaceae bacterium]
MKTYVLTIEFDENTEEIEFLTEEILTEHTSFFYGDVEISEWWDKETLELMKNGYIFGET